MLLQFLLVQRDPVMLGSLLREMGIKNPCGGDVTLPVGIQVAAHSAADFSVHALEADGSHLEPYCDLCIGIVRHLFSSCV